MARSTYVYVALNKIDRLPAGAFTVKRELRNWLSRLPDAAIPQMQVWRLHDGSGGMGVEMNIDDIIS